MAGFPTIQLLTYSFALWFGLYLLARNPEKPGLRFAGLGLLAYALGIGLDVLTPFAGEIARFRAPLLFLPPLFWLGATLYLLPDTAPYRIRDAGLLVVGTLAYGLGVIANTDAVYWAITDATVLLAALALYRVWHVFRSKPPQRSMALLMTAGVFFLFSNGALLIPRDWLSNDTVVLAIGLDLALLAYIIVALDAYDEGETLLPDFLRSFGASMLAALIFGGQVVLVMAVTGGVSPTLLLLLLALVSSTLILQTLSDPLHRLLDRLLLSRFPGVQRERARLRDVASALPRVNMSLNPASLSDDQFARLTRRALSHMGDIGRLASSPLTRLSVIDRRLNARGGQASILERAAELRALLEEQIEKLKPRGAERFGTTDEWRFYNALYFPYVAGLKPFSRRDLDADLDADTRAALEWFRTYIPERTLHNWQNAAAKLIAQDLRELTEE